MKTNEELKKMIEELEAKTALEIDKLKKQHEQYLLDAQKTADKWKQIDEVLKKQLDEVCKPLSCMNSFTPLLAVGASPIAESLKKLGEQQKMSAKREHPEGFIDRLKKLMRKDKK